MASLYFDHNISLHLVSPLQAAGHTIVTARDLGLTRLTDDAQLLTAVRAGHMLVTHNRGDFTLLHDAWLTWPAAFQIALPPHSGILILDPAPYQTLGGVLDAFLMTMSPGSLDAKLVWWHHRYGWRRRLVSTGRHPYP